MLFNTKVFIVVTISTLMLVDSYRVNQRDSEKQMQRRDYRPNKWLTNSAMDIWYGNKTFIDIIWREFSDLMYKLTDRDGKLQLVKLTLRITILCENFRHK